MTAQETILRIDSFMFQVARDAPYARDLAHKGVLESSIRMLLIDDLVQVFNSSGQVHPEAMVMADIVIDGVPVFVLLPKTTHEQRILDHIKSGDGWVMFQTQNLRESISLQRAGDRYDFRLTTYESLNGQGHVSHGIMRSVNNGFRISEDPVQSIPQQNIDAIALFVGCTAVTGSSSVQLTKGLVFASAK